MTESTTERLRAFIAIPLPQSLQQQIAALQESLCLLVPELQPVKLKNLHLTLHFLGEQTHDQLAKVAASMLSIGQKKKTFNVSLEGLGLFPNQRKPKVLWLGIQPETKLLDLYNQLSVALQRLGQQPDPHPYRPHLTIGRFKGNRHRPTDLCHSLSHSCDILQIDKLILYRSTLTANGAIHTPLQTVELVASKH